ncbi:MAG: hypothetical protein U9Q69_02270 [Nanoarchaeota archaeon]|nr:hypothetical protein [Nanoarchaeota archaeon]
MASWHHLKREEDIVPFGYKIKAAGSFDFQELYQELQRWVTYNGYTWQETKYRIVENPGGSKQVEIKWICPKEIDDYITFTIKMDLQVFHSDIEANVDGVKKKLNKGSYEFRLGAKYEKDWDVWENRMFGNIMKLIYEKILIRKRIEAFEDMLFAEVHELFNEIKAYMKLYGTE